VLLSSDIKINWEPALGFTPPVGFLLHHFVRVVGIRETKIIPTASCPLDTHTIKAKHSIAQYSIAQYSIVQHSTVQHSTA
jgi:hypothetical protein